MIYLRAGRMAIDLENSMVVKENSTIHLNYPDPVFTKVGSAFQAHIAKYAQL